MPIPAVYKYPIKRPAFITQAFWGGQPGADELQLTVIYPDHLGQPTSKTFHTKVATEATLCLPTTAVLADLPEDLLIAHVRMVGMISGTVPGSKEYTDALTLVSPGTERNFQMPVGDVKVIEVISVDDSHIRLRFQKGTGPVREITCGLDELADYSFAPSTQLLIVPGAVRQQFPNHIQDPANGKFLTQDQMDDIASYVLSLQPWV